MSVRRPKVLGAGLVALDLVVSLDPTVPVQAWAGGTCGNVTTLLAWHGWDAYPIARLNGDAAAERVRADLDRWGVHLDLAGCTPASNTPIVVQEIRRSLPGKATHKFSWTCLRCGGWLPSFKPVTRGVVEQAEAFVSDTSVFFFDRLSRGTLDLASLASASGALVFFEPSGRGDERLFAEALELAHVVKYADQRISVLAEASPGKNRMLEIQTLGAAGLRFRTPRGGWRELSAVAAERVVDSCGSGDWCTAGLLAKTATEGQPAFGSLTFAEIEDGLMYGQQLAAWNCAFEGARGGMYSSSIDEAPLLQRQPTPTTVSRACSSEPISNVIQCPKCAAA